MRTATTILLATAALLVATARLDAQTRPPRAGHWGETQAIRFQMGVFTPRGNGDYWRDNEIDFTGDAESFEDVNGGISYVRYLGPRLGLAVSGNFYEATEPQHYLNYVDGSGREIFHDTTFGLANFNLGLLLHLARRDAAIVPYVGAGAGLYLWNLQEEGDFIDFPSGGEIFSANFEDDGATFGHYLQVGLEVPIAQNWSVFADARWERADDELNGDFDGLGNIDLSGRSLSLGASLSF
jgi:hypothetical protein